MYCGKTRVPLGTRVKVIATNTDLDEEFLGLTGCACHPFSKGCCDVGWLGVRFDRETNYGWNFNFHIDELAED